MILAVAAVVAVIPATAGAVTLAPTADGQGGYWTAAGTGTVPAPPAGDTGGYYWVNGENGTVDTGDWIGQAEFQQIVNQSTAATYEGAGQAPPEDLPAADASEGSTLWSGVESAGVPAEGGALELLETAGFASSFAAFAPVAAEAVGAAYIGWRIGSGLASILGLTGNGDVAQPYPNVYEGVAGAYNVGQHLTSPSDLSAQFGSHFAPTDPVAPSDGWLAMFNRGDVVDGADGTSGMPAGAEPIVAGQGCQMDMAGNCTPYTMVVYFFPAVANTLPGQPAPQTSGAFGQELSPAETAVEQGVAGALTSPNYGEWNGYVHSTPGAAGASTRCYSDPNQTTIAVPSILDGESASDYQTCLSSLGLHAQLLMLDESDPFLPDSAVTETVPESGTPVSPNSTVQIAVNPPQTKFSTEDPQCDVNQGSSTPGGAYATNPPSDGTNYPYYQLVENSPYAAAVDPSGSSPPLTSIPLRWGTTAFGRWHILLKHTYTDVDRAQTEQALATDQNPTFGGFTSTKQYNFHLFYTMVNGQPVAMPNVTPANASSADPGAVGGSALCVRTVTVEYWEDAGALDADLSGIRGIQNSYDGRWIGG